MSFIILRTYFIKCSFPFFKIFEWRKIFASILFIYYLLLLCGGIYLKLQVKKEDVLMISFLY